MAEEAGRVGERPAGALPLRGYSTTVTVPVMPMAQWGTQK
jgi:hypothetical protein